MLAQSVCLPQNVIIDLLKELPEDALRDIFWQVFIDNEDYALDDEERSDLLLANDDWEKGETIEWKAYDKVRQKGRNSTLGYRMTTRPLLTLPCTGLCKANICS